MNSTRQQNSIHNINPEAENQHFRIADSIISWMENCKSSRDNNPEISLTAILPPQAQPLLDDHQLSAPGVAWNLVRIFRMKKLKHLVDIRKQLYYLKIYISTCPECEKLNEEFENLTNQHMLKGDVHAYTLNSLVDIKNGELYEYLDGLVSRSITHIINCDRCRAKGHYCQLCGPSCLMSSMILNGGNGSSISGASNGSHSSHSSMNGIAGGITNDNNKLTNHTQTKQQEQRASKSNPVTISQTQVQMPPPHSLASASNSSLASLRSACNDYELIFPFEIGSVAQCHACGCCYHLKCFIDAGENCPKCERIQRRKAEQTSEQEREKQTEQSHEQQQHVEQHPKHVDNSHQLLLQR